VLVGGRRAGHSPIRRLYEPEGRTRLFGFRLSGVTTFSPPFGKGVGGDFRLFFRLLEYAYFP
jgi:hypothetical protein